MDLKDIVNVDGIEGIEDIIIGGIVGIDGIEDLIGGIMDVDGIEDIDMIGMDIVGIEGMGVLSRIDYRRFYGLGLGARLLLHSVILLSISSPKPSLIYSLYFIEPIQDPKILHYI